MFLILVMPSCMIGMIVDLVIIKVILTILVLLFTLTVIPDIWLSLRVITQMQSRNVQS